MIEQLNLKDPSTAQEILNVQIPAYKIEAEQIGFDGIPQLYETIDDIRQSGETFYGFYQDCELAGCIALQEKGDTIGICRLFVHPGHFRKGIASKLLNFILTKEKRFTVSTGAANSPAIKLYEKAGFKESGKLLIAPNVFLMQLVREQV